MFAGLITSALQASKNLRNKRQVSALDPHNQRIQESKNNYGELPFCSTAVMQMDKSIRTETAGAIVYSW